ncbi:hypothetical protein [Actinopolymorpha alba]|uniref:hypothetical protein n=1 Tax=Actinopolymorpha alba TaxID=533267 RepID=UPI00037DD801|nr:hypothetical protein [Actinopolymorpha alba]
MNRSRILVPSAALLWGLQLAFLSPAFALILTELYNATTAEVGWVRGGQILTGEIGIGEPGPFDGLARCE